MTTQIFGPDQFNLVPHAVAMLIAYALAFPLGWNREKEERSAGLRTFPLVAIASCGFIQAAEVFATGHPDAMSRVVEGLLAGMGFIGGGAILRRENSVKGTATAASLWVTGAIGVAAGVGSYDVAVMLSVAAFVSLRLLQPLKKMANLEEVPSKRTARTKG